METGRQLVKSNRRRIGQWGEALAAEKVCAEGFEILEQNYRTPYGELDLIARKDSLVIFIEVKTRTSLSFGLPEESVTARKKEHIIQSIAYYLQQHADLECDWRADVIAIQGKPGKEPCEMVWFENALA